MVGNEIPAKSRWTVGEAHFELHAVCILRANTSGQNAQEFNAIHYMRHSGFNFFWKQERNVGIVIKYLGGQSIFDDLCYRKTPNSFFYSCVSMHVGKGNDEVDREWETTFFKSMGVKTMPNANAVAFLFC